MRLVLMSDTHGRHDKVVVPPGDVLIHCGDFSYRGDEYDLMSFVGWLSKLPHKVKLCVAGNHDSQLEANPKLSDAFSGVAEYLYNSGTTYQGLNFWGSPFQPAFNNWSFNLPRNGEELKNNWDEMPDNCDVLLTHGPSYGVLDRVGIELCGCELLLERVKVVKPLIHCCGHIHEGRGFNDHSVEGVAFVNATLLDGSYKMAYNPVVLDVSESGIEVVSF